MQDINGLAFIEYAPPVNIMFGAEVEVYPMLFRHYNTIQILRLKASTVALTVLDRPHVLVSDDITIVR
jgi:hypothetical protein